MELINTKILLQPMNWLIVVVVLIFVSYAFFVIHTSATTVTPGV